MINTRTDIRIQWHTPEAGGQGFKPRLLSPISTFTNSTICVHCTTATIHLRKIFIINYNTSLPTKFLGTPLHAMFADQYDIEVDLNKIGSNTACTLRSLERKYTLQI